MLKEYEKELLILGTYHGWDISGYHDYDRRIVIFSIECLVELENEIKIGTTRHIHVASVEEKLHLGRRLSFLLLSSPFPASSRTNLLVVTNRDEARSQSLKLNVESILMDRGKMWFFLSIAGERKHARGYSSLNAEERNFS